MKRVSHNCLDVGHFARNCPKRKKSNTASSSGGGDLHCWTYTDDRNVMFAQVGSEVEQENNIEFLLDFGAA